MRPRWLVELHYQTDQREMMPQGASTTTDRSRKGPETGCLFPSHKESIVIDPAPDGGLTQPPSQSVCWLPPTLTLRLYPSWTPLVSYPQSPPKSVHFSFFSLSYFIYFEKGLHCVALPGLELTCRSGGSLTRRDLPLSPKC